VSQMLSCMRSLSLAVGVFAVPLVGGWSILVNATQQSDNLRDLLLSKDQREPTELPGWVRGCPKEAVAQVLSSARAYNVRGEYLAGLVYLNGCGGTPADPRAAREWLEGATKAGEPDAAGTLGALYQIGVGTEKNNFHAAELYWQAAEKGHKLAWLTLLDMYARGDFRFGNATTNEILRYCVIGRAKYLSGDSPGSFSAFKHAADLGGSWARVNVAEDYETGTGAPPNWALAKQLYEECSRQGNTYCGKELARAGSAHDAQVKAQAARGPCPGTWAQGGFPYYGGGQNAFAMQRARGQAFARKYPGCIAPHDCIPGAVPRC
jgi:Sel1 repeat-containing protein